MHFEDRGSSIEEALWRSSNRGDTDGSSTALHGSFVDAFPGTEMFQRVETHGRTDLSQSQLCMHPLDIILLSAFIRRDVSRENSCEVRAESRAVCIIYITQYNRPTLFICFSLVDIYKQRVDIFLKPFSASHNKIHNGCSLMICFRSCRCLCVV